MHSSTCSEPMMSQIRKHRVRLVGEEPEVVAGRGPAPPVNATSCTVCLRYIQAA